MAIITKFLIALQRKKKQIDSMIVDCLQRIEELKGQVEVKEIENYYCVTQRQLERRFESHVGVSPRYYLKITRFQRALMLLKNNPSIRFGDVAFQCGYYDQAHFIKHTRQLTALSPTGLRSRLQKLPVNQKGSTHYLVDLV